MTKDHATAAQLVEQWATKADEAGELGREYEHRDLIRSAYYYTEAASYRARSDELAAALAQGGAAVYPDSDRGLKQMCPGVPVAILRGIQEAAFRAGRESVLTPLAQGWAHEPPCGVCGSQESADGDWYRVCGPCHLSGGAQGWQPIATAPLNESVLVYIPNAEHYGDGIYRAIHVDMGTGKRWTSTGRHVGRDLCGELPTHWMPLPVPPTGETP